MNCPVCGGNTIVADSRPQPDTIKRRRKCVECNYRFSTFEIDEDQYRNLVEYREKVVEKIKWESVFFSDTLDEAVKRIKGKLDELTNL